MKVQVDRLKIEGLKLVKFRRFDDERGFFAERFQKGDFQEAGLPFEFVQDNVSKSVPGVVRGLHYQFNPCQGKLVGVLSGQIVDIAVDLRMNSPTFGKYQMVELSGDDQTLFWIPKGFAHGFMAVGDSPAIVMYKVDSFYNGKGESGIKWDDPDLDIKWPDIPPIVSPKDQLLPSLEDYKSSPHFS